MNGNPLDFSFLKLQDIESKFNHNIYEGLNILQLTFLGLKKEEPRAGKRKPVEENEDEEDKKVELLFKEDNICFTY